MRRTRALGAALGAALTAIGCTGIEDAGEGFESFVCSVGGQSYRAGDSIPAADECNTCRCEADGTVLCTLRSCGVACNLEDMVIAPGETVVIDSGCAVCLCLTGGVLECHDVLRKPDCEEPATLPN